MHGIPLFPTYTNNEIPIFLHTYSTFLKYWCTLLVTLSLLSTIEKMDTICVCVCWLRYTIFLHTYSLNQNVRMLNITGVHRRCTSQVYITGVHHKRTTQVYITSKQHRCATWAYITGVHHRLTSQNYKWCSLMGVH